MLSDLIAEARADAKAFRENAVYTAEGSRVKLGANADRLDQYADRIEAQAAEIERLRVVADRVLMHDPDGAGLSCDDPIALLRSLVGSVRMLTDAKALEARP